MADEFQSGICGGSWWNAARSGGFDGTSMSAGATSVPSTATTADAGAGSGGAFSWSGVEMVEVKAKSFDHEPAGSASGSSITYQDTHKGHPSDHMMGGQFMDPSLQIPTFGLSTPTMDWNQALLRSSGRAETSFHALLQDDLSSRPFFHQDPSINSDQVHTGAGDSPANPYRNMNQSFLLDQHHLSSSNEPGDSNINSFSSTMVLQGLFEQDTKPQQPIYENRSVNYQSPMMGYRGSSSELPPQSSWPKFPPFLKPSPPKQQPTNQLQFSNNTPFWNASAASVNEVRSSFYPPMPTQFAAQTFDQKPSCSSPTTKSNSEGARESSSSTAKKSSSSSSEPAFKKPRIETPSPLPTFKVRKEKLGDRITALQQLVSPFGKTDTASVLHEAIDYIKYLHDQVSVLSTPYLKNGNPMQHQQGSDKSKDGEGPKQDLRSRGLCLVPIQITYPVASEPQADFWTPTFGGTYR